MNDEERLSIITGLSREFGTPEFVKGAGGNTSAKNAGTLWIKPSGTCLCNLAPGTFIALNRARLEKLYSVHPPEDAARREALVTDLVLNAVEGSSPGRPSVESPLHDSFHATFVVHTHAALVNGMTCAKGGAAACRRLFPDALWMDYIDPGYMLCMVGRRAIKEYAAAHGRDPPVLFLKNHGVFAAGDTADEIRASYRQVTETLEQAYRKAGVETNLRAEPAPDAEWVEQVRDLLRRLPDFAGAEHIVASGPFAPACEPLTPDHIVHAGAYPYTGEPDRASLMQFKALRSYYPGVIAAEEGVLGLGANARSAELALRLAADGALVRQLAEAFGGVEYMTNRAADFIDHWEAEAFRKQRINT